MIGEKGSGGEGQDLPGVGQKDLEAPVARLDLADDLQAPAFPGPGVGEALLLGEMKGQVQPLSPVGNDPPRRCPGDPFDVDGKAEEAPLQTGQEGPDLIGREGPVPGQAPEPPSGLPGRGDGVVDPVKAASVGRNDQRQGQPGLDEEGTDKELPVVVGKPGMGQKTAVAVPCGDVPFEAHRPSQDEGGVEPCCLGAELLFAPEGVMQFGRVDEQVADRLRPAPIEGDDDGVAVKDLRHRPPEGEGSGSGESQKSRRCQSCGKRTDRRGGGGQERSFPSGQNRGSSSGARGMR